MKGSVVLDRALFSVICSLGLFVICLGCGPGVELAPCEGTVEFEGVPLTAGKVLLTSTDKGQPALASIEPDGRYELVTINVGDGVPPGSYHVTVITDIEYQGKMSPIACSCPPGFELTVEAGQDNEFKLNVSESDGWEVVLDN